MQRQASLPKMFITAEIHPQFSGDVATAQTMMVQAKLGQRRRCEGAIL